MTEYRSVGITGSLEGLTGPQLRWAKQFIQDNVVRVLHHGNCIGGDEDVATLFYKGQDTYIIAHPGHISTMQSKISFNDLVLPEKHTLARNRLIVNSSDLLLGFPKIDDEDDNSGSWYTIRWAKRHRTPVIVISPTGMMTLHSPNEDVSFSL